MQHMYKLSIQKLRYHRLIIVDFKCVFHNVSYSIYKRVFFVLTIYSIMHMTPKRVTTTRLNYRNEPIFTSVAGTVFDRYG
jgi:hypothetical protein